MNIKEKFGCDFESYHESVESQPWITCPACEGTGYSDAKILAYVKEQGLENVVAGCRIVEAIESKKITLQGKDCYVYFYQGHYKMGGKDDCLDLGLTPLNAIAALLGEEKEG